MRATRVSTRWRTAALALLVSVFSIGSLSALPEGDRALKIYHIHTGEQATIVFKRNGVYDKDGLQKLNYILRDWRKQRPTNMDPHLFDLLWQVYQASGATDPIHVVCGFRSPETNAMLRRRSKGVAQHSQHMLGKATDFFIPGVPLAKLREIGLRMQTGGVGYYPSSGSPFVHMDTGSVRMWPRMTHDQLARVFPNGKTLYVPSDGRPLPGYDSALAAYKSRKAFGTAVVLADSGGDEGDDNDFGASASKKVIVLTPRSAALEVPLPRRAPPRLAPALDTQAVVAMAEPQPPARPAPLARERLNSIFDAAFPATEAVEPVRRSAGKRPGTLREVDFDATYGASAPPVPPMLARAMAARDESVRSAQVASASLPIAPTAIVATVDVTRPQRAATMTAAAFSGSGDTPVAVGEVPPVLAYASPEAAFVPEKPKATRNAAFGTRVPSRAATPVTATLETPVTATLETNVEVVIDDHLYAKLPRADLTLTALDTQGLRLWIATQSTREKRYALLTMPDFSQQPSLLDKPVVTYASGFGHTPYEGLRTDRFAGQLVQPLAVVDLTGLSSIASK